MEWTQKLQKLVRFYADPAKSLIKPFYLWAVDQPVPFEWPAALPFVDSLHRFYTVCGGGEFGPMIRFVTASRLAEQTESWTRTLRDYDARGDILFPGRHIVFANDADGTPWIVDASSGRVASFYWKGGDWEEPQFTSHDEFMNYVFRPGEDYPDWMAALEVILQIET